jgi:hypothetical protein
MTQSVRDDYDVKDTPARPVKCRKLTNLQRTRTFCSPFGARSRLTTGGLDYTQRMKYVALAMAVAVVIVIIRAMLMRTLSSRMRGQGRADPVLTLSLRAQVGAALAWPVFFVLVAAVLGLGVLVGSLLGPH